MAGTRLSQEQYAEAESLFAQLLEDRRRVLGSDHRNTLSTMNDLSIVWKCQGRFDEAIELLSEAIEIRHQTVGPEDSVRTWFYGKSGWEPLLRRPLRRSRETFRQYAADPNTRVGKREF